MLAWSGDGRAEKPQAIGEETVQQAVSLWSGYFRPQARGVFNQCGRTDRDRLARRAAKWLKTSAYQLVSCEDVRLYLPLAANPQRT